jgi:hypothetical protein
MPNIVFHKDALAEQAEVVVVVILEAVVGKAAEGVNADADVVVSVGQQTFGLHDVSENVVWPYQVDHPRKKRTSLFQILDEQ